MAEKSQVRRTTDSLLNAGLIIRGRLFDSNSDSLTVDADGVHYDVLIEYVTNAAELAHVKQGEAIEVKVSPDARIVEKRLIGPNLPGIITDEIFGRVSDLRRGDTQCSDCTQCSHCSICRECSYCTICRPPLMYQPDDPFHGGFARPYGSYGRPAQW